MTPGFCVSKRIVEPFSYISILNVNGLSVFPKNVEAGDTLSFKIEIGNYESKPEYYKILIKVGDQTSNVTDLTPFNAPFLKSFERLVANNHNSTIKIDLVLVNEGINQRIIFELYKYDITYNLFTYYGWNQVWMNVTKKT